MDGWVDGRAASFWNVGSVLGLVMVFDFFFGFFWFTYYLDTPVIYLLFLLDFFLSSPILFSFMYVIT